MAYKKALIERALGAEMSDQLGYPAGGAKPEDASNHRNGSTFKKLLTADGSLRIAVPSEREFTFELRLILYCAIHAMRNGLGQMAGTPARGGLCP